MGMSWDAKGSIPGNGEDLSGMLLTMCRAKITLLQVTATALEYEGSITVDTGLLEAAGIRPYEQVHVLNLNNGRRIITYAIPGEAGSGVVCLNGPAARAGVQGDLVTILAYAQVTAEEAREWRPTLIRVGAGNRVLT